METTNAAELKIVIVGGRGRSALIGRLLSDTGAPPPREVAEIEALEAGRGQAVAGGTTRVRFRTPRRDYVIIEAPSQREFLEHMVGGAARADAALLVVDAAEGLDETARRHAYLLHLLGIGRVAAAVTGIDPVDVDEGRFAETARDVTEYLGGIGIAPTAVVPISARDGGERVEPGEGLAWYRGPSLIEALDRFPSAAAPAGQPLRLPIQGVDEVEGRRVLAGRVESGVLRVGDRLLFSPSNKLARVQTIEAHDIEAPVAEARAGESIGVTLDERLFIGRGEIASHEDHPPQLTTVFRATLFWLGRAPLETNKRYKLELATREDAVTVQSVERVVDIDTLARRSGEPVERHDMAEVVLRSRGVLALDEYRGLACCGRCTLIDGSDTVARGIISMEGYPDQRPGLQIKSTNVTSVEHRVAANSRAERNGHRGGVMWFTGLSGAGKSTLAMEVEQRLFMKGYHVYVLDGDNVRRGLNANLGFSPGDRTENIRRVGELAGLFADAGFICISAFISPYQADRDRARSAADGVFHEIYIDSDLETCERRDPKGLYKRARAGEIADFTGVSAPYEPPEMAEMRVDTAKHTVEECVARILDYVEKAFALAPAGQRREAVGRPLMKGR